MPISLLAGTWAVKSKEILRLDLLAKRGALKSREERMVTPAMGAAMIGPMYYPLRENRAQHGGNGFHMRLSTLQGSAETQPEKFISTLFRPQFFVQRSSDGTSTKSVYIGKNTFENFPRTRNGCVSTNVI